MVMAATLDCQAVFNSAAASSAAVSSKPGHVQCIHLQSRSLSSRQPAFGAAVASRTLKLQRRGSQVCRVAAPVQSVLEETTLPSTYVKYETMIVLRPDLTDQARDVELAKFEAFLQNQECMEIEPLVRGRQPLAYPIKGFWEGIYVLYKYAARPSVSPAVQKLLSTPEAGNENIILRHMTFRQ